MKKVELPIIEPLLTTYHRQGSAYAIIGENPSAENWYLNNSVSLECNRKFLTGYTTPEITICKADLKNNPLILRSEIPIRYAAGHTCDIIRRMLDDGRYVYFTAIDDFYVKGKSWYNKRHFSHDGMIIGYDNSDKTFILYAYDENWKYRVFKTPCRGFEEGRKSMEKKFPDALIIGIKVSDKITELSVKTVRDEIKQYLDSDFVKYPVSETNDKAKGIIVHEYIGMYIDRLINGDIPYEKTDRRVFRLIWDHKRLMEKRLSACLEKINVKSDIPEKYKSLVKEADNMRMLYAAHILKKKETVLPVIKQKLLKINQEEKIILNDFINKTERFG